jgi:citrate synthase
VVLNQIGVPAELFTPSFAVSRTIGWMAHALEQMTNNRIVRPASRYIGELKAVPLR